MSCVRFGGIPWCLRGWVVCGLGAGVPVCLCAGLRDHVAGSGPEDVYWGKGPGCVAGCVCSMELWPVEHRVSVQLSGGF